MDAPKEEAQASANFWGGAFGVDPLPGGAGDPYTVLPGVLAGLQVEVQAVDDTPRYHLDIETDNVAAEVARLASIGAVTVSENDGWTIMRAPGGHLFCVVPVQSDPSIFFALAQPWA